MKITIVQGAFLPVPPLMGGGVEKIDYALGREFARRGCTVTHISRRYPTLPDFAMSDGVEYRRLPGFDAPASLVKLKLYDLIYSLRALRELRPADILVTNTFWLPLLVRTQRFGKLYVAVHRYPKGQMRLYRHAQRLQAVSSTVANAIIEQAPACRDIVKVVPNPLPEKWIDPPVDVHAARENWILYVGRVHPEKGLHVLADAFAQMVRSGDPRWRLVIVGPWETRYGGGGESYYQQVATRLETVKDRVDWVGPVFEEATLKSYYDCASLFVYPSFADRGEALPMAPVEAMARGCIPIVSGLSCFLDYLRDGCNGYVFDHQHGDPAARLANTLTEIVKQSAALASIRQAAVQTAEKYTFASITTEMLADFKALCGDTKKDG